MFFDVFLNADILSIEIVKNGFTNNIAFKYFKKNARKHAFLMFLNVDILSIENIKNTLVNNTAF